MKKNNQGFTLIELIIVIVILGILAVTAAPRFLDLTGDARASTVQALEGSIKGASNLVNAKFIVAGTSTIVTGTVDVLNDDVANDNTTTDDNVAVVNGFPSVAANGLARAIEVEGDEYVARTIGTETRYYPEGMTNTDTSGSNFGSRACYATYTQATAGDRPTINSVTTGCSN